jgi:hypothetical protein
LKNLWTSREIGEEDVSEADDEKGDFRSRWEAKWMSFMRTDKPPSEIAAGSLSIRND